MQGPEFQEDRFVSVSQAQLLGAYQAAQKAEPSIYPNLLDQKFKLLREDFDFEPLPPAKQALILGAYQVLVRLLTPGRS